MAVEKWKFMQRAGGYKHEDVLNKAYDVLNNHGLNTYSFRSATARCGVDSGVEWRRNNDTSEERTHAISVGHGQLR